MIRNEQEYHIAVNRVLEEGKRFEDHRSRLKASGLMPEEIKRIMDPMVCFHEQLREEIQYYERLKRCDFETLENLEGIGKLLVGLRIAIGMSQRDLAKRLEVHETQVSRDERNEYHGITIDRVVRVLKALGVQLQTKVVVTRSGLEAKEVQCS